MIFSCLHTILIFANLPVRSQGPKNLFILIFSVLFLSHCYKLYRIDQFRGLSYWVVKIALTSNWCKRICFTSVRINIRCNQKKLLNLLQKRVFPRYWWFFCCLHTILIFANFPVRSQGQTKMCSSLDSDIFCLVFVPLL